MNIKILKSDNDEVVFLIKGIDYVIANTIRRAIINEVPSLAIEDIEFIKNNSALYDEMLAHRLGLVPLTSDLKSYVLREECKCEGKGCHNCQLVFSLKANGPCTVYASDIKTKDSKVKPVYPKMVIVKLLKGQDLEAEGIIVLGKGKEHQKFSPGLAYYRAYPEFEIKSCSACEECVKACPKKILKLDGKKVKVIDIEKCDLCKACEEKCKEGAIKVNGSKTDFIFIIEPWGQLSAKEILMSVADILDEKLDNFEKLVNKIK